MNVSTLILEVASTRRQNQQQRFLLFQEEFYQQL